MSTLPPPPDALPEVLVISPAKTGTTWLHHALSSHPRLSLPSQKELHFFSDQRGARDLPWYTSQFPAPRGRIKVDVSPTYALLPRSTIGIVQRLMPHAKLVFLTRDPVARAWSHAKHMYAYGERNFARHAVSTPGAPVTDWSDNFIDDWPLSFGSYAECLRRWLTFFPREQFYVGFYEHIHSQPAELLDEICHFAGVPPIKWDREKIERRVLAGTPGNPTAAQERLLRFVLRRRAQRAVALMQDEFGVSVPAAYWSNTLEGSMHAGPYPHTERYADAVIHYDGDVFRAGECESPISAELKLLLNGMSRDVTEDVALQQVLDSMLLYQQQHPIERPGTDGFNIVQVGGRHVAAARALGPIELFKEPVGMRDFPPLLLVDADEDNLRARVAAVEASSRRTFELIECGDAFNLVRADERFYAVARALGEVDLLAERLGDREIPEILLIDSDECRLRARVAALQATRLPVLEVIEERAQHTLVRAGSRVLAVARSLGPVDLLAERIGEREIPGVLLIDDNEARLRERLAPIEAQQRPPLEVIEERATHVLVRAGAKILAVARSLGPVDLLAERLGEREIPGVLLIDDNEAALRARLAELEAQQRPPLEVIEERAAHVLVRAGAKVLAVARSLGPVDLLAERLGEREIPGVLLIDDDEAALRARLAELEAQERPCLEIIEERASHVVVRAGAKVLAVALSLGPVDLLAERLGQREIPGVLLIDDDEAALRARLAELEAQQRPPLEVIEERATHVLVRAGAKVFALARSLGPVDLLAERLGERDIPGVLLIDDDETHLRERLARVEAQQRPLLQEIEVCAGYTLIRGGGKVYAVSRTLGPLDLLEERLGDREIPGILLIDEDEDRLRARVNHLSSMAEQSERNSAP